MDTEQIDPEKPTATDGSPAPSSALGETLSTGAIKQESDEATESMTETYPHGARLTAIASSLMLGMFLVALDNVSTYLICQYKTDISCL